MKPEFAGNRKTNSRRYPRIKGRRPDNAKFRREEAKERQAAYDKLSVQTKIQKLDAKLGVGVGAVKQRARLQKMLDGGK